MNKKISEDEIDKQQDQINKDYIDAVNKMLENCNNFSEIRVSSIESGLKFVNRERIK